MDFRPYDREALALCERVVDRVTAADLDRETPCAPWPVRDLLSHMVAQHLRFGAVARGEDPKAACPVDKGDLGTDPVKAFRDACNIVTESFAAGADDQLTNLPEIGRPVPLGTLIPFHFFDFIVHAWDVAVSINAPFAPPAEYSALAFEVGQVIPDSVRGPGAAFAPKVDVGSDADELAKLLGLAGRDPSWALR